MNPANHEASEFGQAAQDDASLGAMLRRAREGMGLSTQDLAKQLNLGGQLIDALEREDLAALPDRVYVQGYLRRLASTLQLAPEQVLEAYTRLAGHEVQALQGVLTPVEPMRPINAAPAFKRLRWLLLIGIISVVALGTYASRYLPESWLDLAKTNPSDQQGEILLNAPIDMEAQSVPLAIEPPPPPVQPEPVTTPVEPKPVVGEVVNKPDESVPAQADKPAQEKGISTLELITQNENSWVQVRDARGQLLLEALLKPGTQRQLQGTPPFEVVIGNSKATRLRLDGQDVDLAPFTRANGKAVIEGLGG